MKTTIIVDFAAFLASAIAQDCVKSPYNGDFSIANDLSAKFPDGWNTYCRTQRSSSSSCGVVEPNFPAAAKPKKQQDDDEVLRRIGSAARDPGTGTMFYCDGRDDGKPVNTSIPYGPERQCMLAQHVDLCPSTFGNDWILTADFMVPEPNNFACYPRMSVVAADGTRSETPEIWNQKLNYGTGWVTKYVFGKGTAGGGRTGLIIDLICNGNATAFIDNVRLATL